jgi:SagB-type dehydrogenase family enzyme
MNNKFYEKNLERISNTKNMEFLESSVLSSKELDEIIKTHQKSTWEFPAKCNIKTPNELNYWIHLAEKTDSYPFVVEDTIQLKPISSEFNKMSYREFRDDFIIEFAQLSNILFNAFGKRTNGHKNYPSAGALYPVVPLLVVSNTKNIPFIKQPGVYIYDSSDHQLLLLTKFDTKEKIKKYEDSISISMGNVSSLAIAYMVDIKKSCVKYKNRGYRHALIEVGLMAQSFRSELWKYDNLGECCLSEFSDNRLAYNLGLSPRLAPILLMQWFGEIV